MPKQLTDVVVIDAVRTAFGRAGEKGLFWKTRAEDLCVPLLKSLIERNPGLEPSMIEDSIWGVTNQVKEQGGTIGRMIPILAEWGWEIPGCSIDRMCASGLTAIGFSVSHIASGKHAGHARLRAAGLGELENPVRVGLELGDHEQEVQVLAVEAAQALDRVLAHGGNAQDVPVRDEPVVEGPGLAEGHPVVDGEYLAPVVVRDEEVASASVLVLDQVREHVHVRHVVGVAGLAEEALPVEEDVRQRDVREPEGHDG